MNVFLTGGAGYIGTVLVESLLKDERVSRIVVLDNLMYKQDGLFALFPDPRLEFVFGDVRDHDKMLPYIHSADLIIPLAAIVGFPACARNPELAKQVNFEHIKFICENNTNIAKIVYPNSNSGYGVGEKDLFCTEETPLNPISVYGKTKCLAEPCVLGAGGIVLRLATVFGTSYRFRKDLLVNDFVLKAMTDKYIVLFESHFKRNFIHVRDVVSAMLRAAKIQGPDIFNVGLSSANLSKLELCQKIQKYVPDFVIKQDEFQQDLDKRDYIVSNEKLEKTGWRPNYTLDQGICELRSAYNVFINANTEYTNL